MALCEPVFGRARCDVFGSRFFKQWQQGIRSDAAQELRYMERMRGMCWPNLEG